MTTYIVNSAGGESNGLIIKAPKAYATDAAPSSPGGGTISPPTHGQQWPTGLPVRPSS